MAQDPRRFKYTSDYSQPIVVYRNQFTLPSSGPQAEDIFRFKHNLPFTPLLVAKVSDTQNFDSFMDVSAAALIDMLADSENVVLIKHSSSDPKTSYIRVIGFAPPDYSGNITAVENDAKFRFNTDYDYLGCIQGSIDVGQLAEVEHNLGYAPQCKSWEWKEIYTSGEGWLSGYSGDDISQIGRYWNTGVSFWMNVSTPTEYLIHRRSDGQGKVTGQKTYFHIYTLEG